MRLMKDHEVSVDHRSHFLAASAVVMRRILVDHARGRLAQKRGGEYRRVTLSFDPTQPGIDVIKIHESLDELAGFNKRAAEVVEKKFFGGMNYTEIGRHLGISSRTVQDDWKFAKAWLYRSMDQS
jgi:RNA polymerase sigma factor (TIGR02999 family)